MVSIALEVVRPKAHVALAYLTVHVSVSCDSFSWIQSRLLLCQVSHQFKSFHTLQLLQVRTLWSRRFFVQTSLQTCCFAITKHDFSNGSTFSSFNSCHVSTWLVLTHYDWYLMLLSVSILTQYITASNPIWFDVHTGFELRTRVGGKNKPLTTYAWVMWICKRNRHWVNGQSLLQLEGRPQLVWEECTEIFL